MILMVQIFLNQMQISTINNYFILLEDRILKHLNYNTNVKGLSKLIRILDSQIRTNIHSFALERYITKFKMISKII